MIFGAREIRQARPDEDHPALPPALLSRARLTGLDRRLSLSPPRKPKPLESNEARRIVLVVGALILLKSHQIF